MHHTLLGCITQFGERVAFPVYNAGLARMGADEDTITRTPFMPWKCGLECKAQTIYMCSSSANQHVLQEAFTPSSLPSLFTSDLDSLPCFHSFSWAFLLVWREPPWTCAMQSLLVMSLRHVRNVYERTACETNTDIVLVPLDYPAPYVIPEVRRGTQGVTRFSYSDFTDYRHSRHGGWVSSWSESYRKASLLVSNMTLAEKTNLTAGSGIFMGRCVGNTGSALRVGIPQLCLQDGPLGVRNTDHNTAFPPGITSGATWDKDLLRRRGVAIGEEFRGKGINVHLGPSVGALGRKPRGGRSEFALM
jgi:hypothetical protein